MEVRKPKIKSMKYEDFTDNEYLEKMIEELRANGTNVVMGCLDEVINWGRSNSLWPLTFATSCCGIEFMAVGAARYDFARFGFEVARASPRQADFIMVAGTITHKMAPVLRRLYDQMADPKYVIATGSCAVSGGPFKKSYHVVNGVDKILPVDVYIPGCPPRPEAMLYGMMQLQRKVKLQKFFGDVNRQIDKKEYEKRLREDLTAERPERRLYDQMADPKYVIATGSCAVSGGPFKKSYHVVNGVDKILPVDVYIPGCPPRPEAMLYGMMQLQRKVKLQKFFGDVNRQIDKKEYEKRLREDLTAERPELNVEPEEKKNV